MSKVIWLNNHGNCFPFSYGFCPSKAAFEREMKKMEVVNPPRYPTAEGCTLEFEERDGDMCALVTIGEGDDKRSPLGVFALLVHEAVHVFELLCRSMGEKNPSSEFKAYTIQMFSSQLIASYIRTRRSKHLNLLVKPPC